MAKNDEFLSWLLLFIFCFPVAVIVLIGRLIGNVGETLGDRAEKTRGNRSSDFDSEGGSDGPSALDGFLAAWAAYHVTDHLINGSDKKGKRPHRDHERGYWGRRDRGRDDWGHDDWGRDDWR